VETADGARSGKRYKQTWNDNMQTKSSPKIKDCKPSDNWTCITFKPDLAKFGMSCLDADAVGLFKKRVHDMAGVTPGVKVFLDDERIKIKNFEEYCNLYLRSAGSMSESGEPPKSVHIKCGDRWEIVVAVSDGQFQQVSFVNSIATTRGGSHVNHVSDQLAQMYLDYLAKKHKGLKLKPFQVMTSGAS
jgi:DNA topoisomerase-2